MSQPNNNHHYCKLKVEWKSRNPSDLDYLIHHKLMHKLIGFGGTEIEKEIMSRVARKGEKEQEASLPPPLPTIPTTKAIKKS